MTIERFVMILEDILIGNIDECQVVPELDAPAHVGAGWQAVDEKLTVCVNREPWTEWSVDVDGDENDDHGRNICREILIRNGQEGWHLVHAKLIICVNQEPCMCRVIS